MIKLKLNLEDLAVDSFDTAGRGGRVGTVRGHETDYGTCGASGVATCGCPGTRYTVCFGICGVETEDGGISCGCETQDCTGDPHDFRCINSENFCFETQQEGCSFAC